MRIEYLNPVAVRVLDEGKTLHLTIIGPLDKVDAKLLEAFARGVYIWHGDADVTCE